MFFWIIFWTYFMSTLGQSVPTTLVFFWNKCPHKYTTIPCTHTYTHILFFINPLGLWGNRIVNKIKVRTGTKVRGQD